MNRPKLPTSVNGLFLANRDGARPQRESSKLALLAHQAGHAELITEVAKWQGPDINSVFFPVLLRLVREGSMIVVLLYSP
jgi:hypothetical protein